MSTLAAALVDWSGGAPITFVVGALAIAGFWTVATYTHRKDQQ